MSVGVPVGKQLKFSLQAHYISNNDKYINSDVLVSTDTLDELLLTGRRFGFHLSTNTLNRKQYASIGKSYDFSVDWFDLDEELKPGSTSLLRNVAVEEKRRAWIRGSLTMEQYFKK